MAEDSYDEPMEDGAEGEEFPLDITEPNFVPIFMSTPGGDEMARKYAAKAVLEYEQAKESQEHYQAGVDSDMRIFYGDLPAKQGRFAKLSNLNIPMALENITRLMFRAEGELFGDWTSVVGVVPIGPDDRDTAELLSHHGNWQINTQIPDFKRQQRRGLLMFFSIGDVTFESSWDPQRRCNRHEALTPDEYYVPYTTVSVMPDWSDVPHRTRIFDYYAHDLEAFYGIWDTDALDSVLKKEAGWEDSPEVEMKMREGMERFHGENKPTDGPAPYRILKHETWCELPGQPRRRFVRMIVDLSSRTLLHMCLHEMPDWDEVARHTMQTQQYNSYLEAKANYDQMIAQPQMWPVNAMTGAPEQPPHPPLPPWMNGPEDKPKRPETVPIHQFTHAICIEPLRGAKGIGFGRIQADLNRAGNSLYNHQMDASTLSNFPPIFVASDSGIRSFKIGAGEITPVQTDGSRSITDMVQPVRVNYDTGSLGEMSQVIYEWARSGIQSPEVLSGEPGKSGESARGLMARIGEATKQVSVSTRAYADQGLTPVMIQNARLNSIHMPEDEPFLVNDHIAGPQMMSAGRALYRRVPYVVKIRSDLKFTSDVERAQQAEGLLAMAVQDPYLQRNAHFGYEVRRRYLESRGQGDIVPLMGQPPPGPPPPFVPPVPPGANMAQPPGQASQPARPEPPGPNPGPLPGAPPPEAAQGAP